MSWPLLAGSIAGVLGLAFLAWMLRLGGGAIEGEEEAMRIARENLHDFEPDAAFVSENGGAALVLGRGEAALLKQHGVHVAARRLEPPFRIQPIEGGAVIATGERMFGDIALKLAPGDRDKLLTMV